MPIANPGNDTNILCNIYAFFHLDDIICIAIIPTNEIINTGIILKKLFKNCFTIINITNPYSFDTL